MKKSLIKFSSVIFATLALFALCAAFFAPVGTASADDSAAVTVSVIKAPVSNLENNASAGISTLKVSTTKYDQAVYIPESYFLQYDGSYGSVGNMHKVTYAGISDEFYFNGEPTVTQITVSSGEKLSPDVTLALKGGEAVYIRLFEITNDYTIKFLGYSEDKTELYVSASLENNPPLTGFIPASSVNDFTIPYQRRAQIERDELLASKAEPPAIIEDGHFTPNTSVALRIVIIIGIAIPTVLIVILLFKPTKNERRYSKNSVRNTHSRDEFDYDDSRSYRRRDERDERDYDRYDRRDDRDYDRDRRYDDRRYDDRRRDD
ncbi:MAG: hypothetical protein NC037_01160 [Bacteroides sp.]|nr:hypothetical protein [Bacillota bacterium]MCM1393806.1 hypothetical protein [[Eubacterium] siraeum]MCM1455125.1 hypothetical protein [Bacteroides sp.]